MSRKKIKLEIMSTDYKESGGNKTEIASLSLAMTGRKKGRHRGLPLQGGTLDYVIASLDTVSLPVCTGMTGIGIGTGPDLSLRKDG